MPSRLAHLTDGPNLSATVVEVSAMLANARGWDETTCRAREQETQQWARKTGEGIPWGKLPADQAETLADGLDAIRYELHVWPADFFGPRLADKIRRARDRVRPETPTVKAPADRNIFSGERLPFSNVRPQLPTQRPSKALRTRGHRRARSTPARRTRGSRRSVSRASSRGGDSGDDSGGGEPPAPDAGLLDATPARSVR